MIHRGSYKFGFLLLLRKASFCIGCVCIVLMNSDTASCKLQQIQRANNSLDPNDPFAEYSEPLPDPFESLRAKDSQKTLSSSQLINPQHEIGNGLGAEKTNGSALVVDEVLELMRQANAFSVDASRPVLPQRTQPGGLISSTCVDPFMTGEQERLLWVQLQRIDGTNWNGLTLEQLFDELRHSLPIRVQHEDLETEGISLKQMTKNISSLAGPIGLRLRLALKPLGLAYECRGSAILISTESSFDDADGQMRIYDVTPLVSQVRDGTDQLVNNLMQTISPDDWLQNGGSSVLNAHVIPAGNRALTVLIIDAPFRIHLEVRSLLDRLNQLSATDPPPSDLNQPSTLIRQQTLSNSQSTVQPRTSPSDF